MAPEPDCTEDCGILPGSQLQKNLLCWCHSSKGIFSSVFEEHLWLAHIQLLLVYYDFLKFALKSTFIYVIYDLIPFPGQLLAEFINVIECKTGEKAVLLLSNSY